MPQLPGPLPWEPGGSSGSWGGGLAEEPWGTEPQALARHVKSLIETQYTYPTIRPLRVYRSLVWGTLLIFKN